MITGIASIGLAVRDLQDALAYYTQHTSFTQTARKQHADNPALNALLGVPEMQYETALLDANTTQLELTQFALSDAYFAPDLMPVVGPGITHVCYQSSAADPAYARFKGARTQMVSRGNQPIDLAGAGITYAYARDPQGNLFEMEQLVQPPRAQHLWLGHVALVTADLPRLLTFYAATLLGMPAAPPSFRFGNNPKLDQVADLEGIDLTGAWIRAFDVHLEFWQYHHPPTPATRRPVLLGGYYAINFQVTDLQAEYQRLCAHGVVFAGAPVVFEDVRRVYGYDVDGNIFQLLEPLS
jgi:catechol 2,3-dioxygenase-like lactoylglutathione lyase family enzyme